MVIREADRIIAARMYQVAVGVVATREQGEIRERADEAMRAPSPASIRALLAVGRDKPWFASVVDALAEVGIAASEDVLGDPS